jgi:TolB-like protein
MNEPRQARAGSAGEEIRLHLDRILASQALAGSDQLKRLLRITVERTISNQSDLLKEYNLGLEVFQRPPDYDPKVDPIVRAQARRLRAKLDEYYAGEGAGDLLIIRLPKGAYIPAFEYRRAHTSEMAASRGVYPGGKARWTRLAVGGGVLLAAILFVTYAVRNRATPRSEVDRSIAVLPLKSFVNDGTRAGLPDQVTEVLTTELAKSAQLRVLSRTTASMYRAPSVSLPELARSIGVRWIVEGGVGSEGARIYVKLRAVDALTDRKIWADVYDVEPSQLVDVSAGVAAKIEAAIQSQLSKQ